MLICYHPFPARIVPFLPYSVRYFWASPWMLYYMIYDVGDIVMMSRCMRGIQQRAERAADVESRPGAI
jgi:hypothetical protein